MPNIAQDTRKQRFIKVVESLNLRFPVAEIEEKVDWDKGSVSKMLNGKLVPSDNFLRKFVKAFNIPEMTYTYITASDFGNKISQSEKDQRIAELEERLKNMEKEKDRLYELLSKAMQKS